MNKQVTRFCLLLLSTLAALGAAREPASTDPFQPVVTKEEAALLHQALHIASTNTAEALNVLLAQRGAEASPVFDFAVGNLHFQEDRLEPAVEAYRAALAKMPHFRDAAMNLGRVYLMLDQPANTIALYQKLVENGEATADILMLLGHALLMEDAPVAAGTAYRQALLLRPRDREVRMGLAKALLRQERFTEGLALVEEILNREPLNRELWSLRVNALLMNNDAERAARSIEQARRLGQATPEMLATLGDLWLNADRPADALEAYEEASTVGELSVRRLLRAMEGFLMTGNADGAERMEVKAGAQLAVGGSPADRVRLLRLRAELALLRGDRDGAMTLCREVLALDPLDGRSLLTLAELQVQAGQLTAAILTCERAARLDGFEADALVRQAQIEVQREHYDRAIPLLESAQGFEPRDHVAEYLQQLRRLVQR